jgi:hypothetical protein
MCGHTYAKDKKTQQGKRKRGKEEKKKPRAMAMAAFRGHAIHHLACFSPSPNFAK